MARKASVNKVLGAPPALLPVIVNPGAVASGIEDRFRTLCQRIKAHGTYTTNIGLDLGIEAPQSEQDLVAAKPALSIKIVAGHPHIDWKKGGFTALDLYGTDDATGNYILLGTLTGHSYADNRALPAAGQSKVRKYKGMYKNHDAQVGQMSDEASITVAGV